MNRGEAIRNLKRKMKVSCNACYQFKDFISKEEYYKYTVNWCKECPVHILTNLMIEELNGNV